MPEPTLALTPDPPERPAAARGQGSVRYHYRTARRARYLTRPGFRAGWAEVRDVSAEGVGLVLGHDPGPGAVILLQLPRRPEGKTHTRLARVVRAEPQPGGKYLVGCRFTPPLSGDELASLLA